MNSTSYSKENVHVSFTYDDATIFCESWMTRLFESRIQTQQQEEQEYTVDGYVRCCKPIGVGA